MVILSCWDGDLEMYLPEDVGNWVEAWYHNLPCGAVSHEFYRFKFWTGVVHQEST